MAAASDKPPWHAPGALGFGHCCPPRSSNSSRSKQEFLTDVAAHQAALSTNMAKLQKASLEQEMERLGMASVYQLDPSTDEWENENNGTITTTSSSTKALNSKSYTAIAAAQAALWVREAAKSWPR
jgi:hypothetical protein